jgi:hypothetical protein
MDNIVLVEEAIHSSVQAKGKGMVIKLDIHRVRTCFQAWKREEVSRVLEGNLLENELAFVWLSFY